MSVTSTLERVCTSQKMLSGHVWLWVMLLWYHRMLGFPVCPCTMTLLALTKFTYTCQDRVINHIHKHIGKAKRLHASPQEKIYITDFRREYGTDVSYPAVLWKPPWRGQKEHWIANQITKQSSIVKYSNQCRITEWRCSLSEVIWLFGRDLEANIKWHSQAILLLESDVFMSETSIEWDMDWFYPLRIDWIVNSTE